MDAASSSSSSLPPAQVARRTWKDGNPDASTQARCLRVEMHALLTVVTLSPQIER